MVNLKRKRSRPSRDDENIERVSEEVQHAPQTSTRRISAQLSIPRTSLLRILHGDLGLRPYRIQLVQRLHRGDKKKRLEFCKWLLDKCRSNSHFCELMIMSDEADFHLDGRVNKQNCRLWSEESPHLMDEIENFSPKVSVWCGIMKDCVIGPYFFEDNNQPVTVNATRYCQMIKRYLIPQLRRRNLSINKLWFQQDGSRPHWAKMSIELLKETFGNRVISKDGAVPWPPRSPDLTAPDFFLWGFVKNEVYAQKINSMEELKQKIRRSIRNINAETLNNVVHSISIRCKECVKRRGGYLENIIYKHQN